jgi:hypothetical protein
MAFEYLVSLEECVGILENYYDLITQDRADWNHEGDIMLPARSVVELSKDELTIEQVGIVQNFDDHARSNIHHFNSFFSLDHARFDPASALDFWLQDETNREVTRVPRDHWWWHPIGASGDD